MFERLQKPFLTVETGEAYQPIRLTYEVFQPELLLKKLDQLKCIERQPNTDTWHWFWRDECRDLHFESLDTYQQNPAHPIRLGTLALRQGRLYLHVTSFKRACLAVSFFYQIFNATIAKVIFADFINKVFGLDERLPHGFSELLKEEELERVLKQRLHDYQSVQEKCEHAKTAEEAFTVLSEYTKMEASKRLPYAERYAFEDHTDATDRDVLFLSFYIFLRSRELIAIRRFAGDTDYTLSDAAEETMTQVFGEITNIDLIE